MITQPVRVIDFELALSAVPPAGAILGYEPSVQTLHVGGYLLLVVLAGLLGAWLWKTRQTRGANLFAAALALTAVRAGSDVVHAIAGEVWRFLEVLALLNLLAELAIGLTLVAFAARYAGRSVASGRQLRFAVGGILVGVAALVLSNPVHGLVVEFGHATEPFVHVGATPGPLWMMIVGTTGLSILVSASLLAHTFTATAEPSWWAAWLLAVGISLTAIVGAVSALGSGPVPSYSYNAAALAAFVLLATPALLGHGLRRIDITARDTVIEEIDDAIVVLDDERRVVDSNAAARELFGRVDDGVAIEGLLDTQVGFPDADQATFEAREWQLLQGQSVADDGSSPDSEASASGDGDTGAVDRHFQVQLSPVTTVTGDRLGYTIRFVDVTALKRRTAELQRKHDRLDHFARTVTEDLRVPLEEASDRVETVRSTLEEATAEPIDDEAVASHVAAAERAVEEMGTIIDDVLAMARSDDVPDRIEEVTFSDAVGAAWAEVGGTADFEGSGVIWADPDRLERLLVHLLQNAVEHAGPDVGLEARLTADGFVVGDDGPGLPPEVADALADDGFSPETMGLGLALVTDVAAAHGWEVAVDQEADGARFVFTGCRTDRSPPNQAE